MTNDKNKISTNVIIASKDTSNDLPIVVGTDGIRGVWGIDIDNKVCSIIGRAIKKYFGDGIYIIGRDSRPSGLDIYDALVQEFDDGVDLYDLGIVPTPLVSYATLHNNAKCGIVITASHNPSEYNGIKLFDNKGTKLDSMQEIEFGQILKQVQYSYFDKNTKSNPNIHKIDLTQQYLEHLTDNFASFKGLKVALDCSNGALGKIAIRAFEKLDAEVVAYNTQHDGIHINENCGAMYPEFLLDKMQEQNIKLGFSFDGDADRVVVLYDNKEVDGDSVLLNLSSIVDFENNPTVVATVLSNGGLEASLQSNGIDLIRTAVGDKNIVQAMSKQGYKLGGEQSGHYIINPYSITGDGLCAALCFAKSIYKDQQLICPKFVQLIPQKSVDILVSKSIMNSPIMLELNTKYSTMLQDKGRFLIRYSGTEPKIRIMVESVDSVLVDKILEDFKTKVLSFTQ
ncbi:MAG: hypothetical protein FWF56_00715 [Firmicutes bacterium]|nr:hypothetical protein [Bacillota bacterium]MCL1953742.1 hypothetical protein [Bacillota bacterium]